MSTQAKTILTIVGAAAILAFLVWSKTFALGPLTVSRAIGLLLMVVGFVCWTVARIELGRSFSIRAKATELVTSGIYAKIRNPVYVFGTLFIAGIILWADRPIWLLVLLVIVPMQVVRARKEAQVLEGKFGEVYHAYRAKTWF
jgi:protein-S-isoprenylcysteine O-methyltransferase Ste14